MIYARMLSVVRGLIGETDSSNSYWSDTEIYNTIHDSQIQVATDAPHLLTFKPVTTTSGTSRYGLPPDFLQLKSVEIDISSTLRRRLKWVSFDEFADITSSNYSLTGQPAYFKIELGSVDTSENHPPGDLWLYPTPDDNGGSNYTLRVYFYQMPTCTSSTTAETEIAKPFHWAICYHAAAMLSLKNDDRSKFQDFMALYDKAIFQGNKMMNQSNRGVTFAPKDSMGYTEDNLL